MTGAEFQAQLTAARKEYQEKVKGDPLNAKAHATEYQSKVRELNKDHRAALRGEAGSGGSSSSDFSEFEAHAKEKLSAFACNITFSLDDSVLENEDALNACSESNWMYTGNRIVSGLEQIFWYESTKLATIVKEEIEEIKITSCGDDTDKQGFSVHGKTVEISIALLGAMTEYPSEGEHRGYIVSAALRSHPEMKLEQLESASYSYWRIKDLVSKEGAGFYTAPESIRTSLKEKAGDGLVYWNTIKINVRGRKQTRGLMITESGFFTFGAEAKKYREHDFSEILAIDLYDASESDAPLKLVIWLREPEKSRLHPKFVKVFKPIGSILLGLIPGMRLVSKIPIKGIKIPKVSLTAPSVSLPSLDLPSWKKPRPERDHPATVATTGGVEKTVHSLTYVVDHKSRDNDPISVEEGNAILVEMAYVLYAAWCRATGRQEEPFWTDALQKNLKTTTKIKDFKPSTE
eukprot:ANDGO_06772.mRNA.1 hypothetical protein